MGAMKELMLETQELDALARAVLCDADWIKECEWHEGEYLESGGSGGDLTDVYKLANAKITSGEITLPGDFTRRDLTDKIKEMSEMYWPDECVLCAKF